MTDTRTEHTAAPFVTFYSFKGGVGRSMALINVAGIVAGRGFRVLVIDIDLEAPGISYLIPREKVSSEELVRPGFVDLLADFVARGTESDLVALSPADVLARYTCAYQIPDAIRQSEEGYLQIMPAGRFDDAYQQRLDSLDLPGLYRDGRGRPLIQAFKKVVQDAGRFDFVFVDSRTGFSDESGICTRDLADHLVVVSGLNRQNVEGTTQFLRALRQATGESRSLLVVLSPVPDGEDELVDERERQAREAFGEAWGKPLDVSLHIPYHPRLALTEEPHIFRRSRGYLYEAYVAIEKSLLSGLGLDASSMIDEATKAAMAGRFAEAIDTLQVAVKLDGGRAALEGMSAQLLTEPAVNPEGAILYDFLVRHVETTSWTIAAWAYKLGAAGNEIADGIYQHALTTTDSRDLHLLINYGVFRWDRGDLDGAETLLRRALELQPKDAFALGNLGSLSAQRGNLELAESLYLQGLSVDSNALWISCNYAGLLFASGRMDVALTHLEIAFKLLDSGRGARPTILVKLFYFAYAHAWTRWPDALHHLKGLLNAGHRVTFWNLELNVVQSRAQGHPEPELVAALAKVIGDEAAVETLDVFSPWNAIKVATKTAVDGQGSISH